MQCESEACRVFLTYVVPALGVVTAVATATAPLKSVLAVRRAQTLGKLNPTPMAFIYVNALIWIQYGLFIRDYFVVAPNLIGALCGNFFTRSTYMYATKKQQRVMDLVSLGFAFIIFFLSTIAFLALRDSPDVGKNLLGVTAIVILASFYSSPLSVLAEVIRTRDASAFHPGLAATCLANGALWTCYGLIVLGDWYVWGPNLLGAIMGAVQLACRAVFGARGAADALRSTSNGSCSNSPSSPHHAIQVSDDAGLLSGERSPNTITSIHDKLKK